MPTERPRRGVNLAEKLSQFDEHWSPRTVAAVTYGADVTGDAGVGQAINDSAPARSLSTRDDPPGAIDTP